MGRKLPALWVLVLIALLAGRSAAQFIPASDEKEVEQMVIDMGSGDPAIRAAASRRLEHAGPDIVPMLQKYVDNDDPEVAARIKAVIHSFGWMRDGAIIISVDGGTQAARLGFRCGDVIVKIDDYDIKGHMDLEKARPGNAATMYVWRAGHVLTFKVAEGRLGILASNWDIAKGGNDQSRGLAAIAAKPPNYAEAYRRLKAAREHGMEDAYSQSVLIGLAAQALDCKYAAREYADYREKVFAPPYWAALLTHDIYDARAGDTPFNSPHCQWLLKHYHDEPFSVELYHELEDWFARNGRNGPMAAELLAKPWPVAPGEVEDMRRFYHELAQMLLGLDQHRYDDVVKVFDGRAIPDFTWYDRETLAIGAAVRGGRGADACRIGLTMFGQKDRRDDQKPVAALWGLASAAATGDDAGVNTFLSGLDQLSPEALAEVSKLSSMDALNQPAAAERIRNWLAARPRAQQPGRFEQIALARLVSSPKSTADEFAAAIKGMDLAKVDADFKLSVLNGYLRFEHYEEATEMATIHPGAGATLFAPEAPRQRARAAIAFAQAHAAELKEKWKDLRGLIQVAEDGQGATWVLRYDGAVFRVDAAGVAQQFEGLVMPPAPVTVAYRHLRVTPGTVAVLYPYGRSRLSRASEACPDLTFIFDPEHNRWTPLAESDGPIDLGDFDHRDTARALAIRTAAKGYPPLPGNLPREHMEIDGFHWFEGDVLVHVDPETRKVTDLSRKIGRLAGLRRAAHVYRLQQPTQPRLLFSDCGLWAFDAAAGKLDRLPLGLKDENVMICAMSESLYGARKDGTILIGVSPQQGGQVFIVDPKTRAVQPTDGFCGLGPADWYGTRGQDWSHRDPQPAIHARFLARLAENTTRKHPG